MFKIRLTLPANHYKHYALQALRLTELESDGRRCYDRDAMQPDRATPLLAVVRIVSVLGMSFAIAAGIFLLLWGKLIFGLLAIVAAIPFFLLMRYMERIAMEEREQITDE